MLMLDNWLGRWFLIKTFDKLDEYDVAEIRRILVDDSSPAHELDQ